MQTLSSSIPHNWIVKAKLEQVLLAMDFRDRTGPFSYFISMACIVTYLRHQRDSMYKLIK